MLKIRKRCFSTVSNAVGNKRALLFPGQGSQYVGMCKDLFEKYDYAREYLNHCNKILKDMGNENDTLSIMFDGNELKLRETINCQTSIYMHSTAIWQILMQEKGVRLNDFEWYLGHSLGEYSALSVNKSFNSFENGLRYVFKRSFFMQECCHSLQGMMAMVTIGDTISMDMIDKIKSIIQSNNNKKNDQICNIANINSPNQIVLSGNLNFLENEICPLISKQFSQQFKNGKKRIKFIKLNTQGAFHSPFMFEAQKQMSKYFKDHQSGNLCLPLNNVIYNFNATSNCNSVDNMIDLLSNQITDTIQWQQSIEHCLKQGVNHFVEIGPKSVLSKLVKQIVDYHNYKSITIRNIDTLQDLQSFQL